MKEKIKTYSNRFGLLILKAITPVVPVNTIRLKNIPAEARFSLEIAEQIVLITENRNSQIVVKAVNENVALIVHETASTCWVAQIQLLRYTGPEAKDAIEQARRLTPPMF